jgi:hypothetical protein
LECDELTVLVENDIGQVDPEETISRSLKFHVEQPAAQSDCTATGDDDPFEIDQESLECDEATLVTYGFQVKICAAQWNEDPSGSTPEDDTDYEACAASPQHEGPGSEGDPDFDNIVAAEDNCPDVFNPDQADTDADNIGDACDSIDGPNNP